MRREWDRTDKDLALLGLKFKGSGEVRKQKPRWKLSVNNKIINICNRSSKDGDQRTEMRETEGSSFRWEKLCKEALFNQNVTWDTKVTLEGAPVMKKEWRSITLLKSQEERISSGRGNRVCKDPEVGKNLTALGVKGSYHTQSTMNGRETVCGKQEERRQEASPRAQ